MPNYSIAHERVANALRIAQRRRAYAQTLRDVVLCPTSDQVDEFERYEKDAEVIEGLCAVITEALSEALATRDLLTEENARLQKERDAATVSLEEARALGLWLGCKVTNLRDSLARQRAENYEMRCRTSDVDSLRYEVFGLRNRALQHDATLRRVLERAARAERERDAARAEIATLRFLQQGGQAEAASASARQDNTVTWEIPRSTWAQINHLIPRGA